MVYGYLPEGGAGGLRQRQGLSDPSTLRLCHLGEYPEVHGRGVQEDRPRERGHAGTHPREPAEKRGRAGGRLRPGGGLGHPWRQRTAGGASGLPPHVRDYVLRPLEPRAAQLP